MPVDKDGFAFRMRQRNDFACSCSGTEIVHDSNSENLNLFLSLQRTSAGETLATQLSLGSTRAEGWLSNGLAE
jgi:hypothetical protein